MLNSNDNNKKRKKSKMNPKIVYNYFLKSNFVRTKQKFHLGFDRLTKIIKCQGEKCKPKRKASVDADDFIVELAYSGCMAFAISIEVEKKKIGISISRQTFIRRLVENHFKYRKKFKVPELTDSQIVLCYNFSFLLYQNEFNFHKENIIFSDEARFSFRPDNCKWWIKEDDMSENIYF